MADLRRDILDVLNRAYIQDPSRYTYVSAILSELHMPYDASVGQIFHSLQTEGLIEVVSTTNVRIRLTAKGSRSL